MKYKNLAIAVQVFTVFVMLALMATRGSIVGVDLPVSASFVIGLVFGANVMAAILLLTDQ
jgi:ethanolamine transporter EutH